MRKAGRSWPRIPRRVSGRTALLIVIGEAVLVVVARAVGIDLGPLAVLSAAVLGLWGLIVALFPPGERRAIAIVASVALGLRVAGVVAVNVWSLLTHGDGYVADDRIYAKVAWALVLWLRGTPDPSYAPPDYGGDFYILGTWTYVNAALFWLFGPNPVLPELLNAGLGAIMVVLIFDVARQVFGPRQAVATGVVLGLYPTLIAWSSLNLKDALALALIAAVAWALLRFQRRPAFAPLLLAVLLLLPMEGLRKYVYILLAVTIVAAVAITPGLRWRPRAGWTLLSAALVGVALAGASGLGPYVRPDILESAEVTRRAMTIKAQSAYAVSTPIPKRVEEGVTFVVTTPVPSPTPPPSPTQPGATPTATPTPTASPRPSPTPAVHVIRPGTRIVVLAETPPPATTPVTTAGASPPPQPTRQPAASEPGVVVVRPGDLVIVSNESDATPAPPEKRQSLNVPASESGAPATTMTLSTPSEVVVSTLAYAPIGLVYALFAPFPWEARRLIEAATIPEMLGWYVVLAAAGWSLWRERRRWRSFGPMLLFVLGGLAVFTIAEGNTGTLIRHRAMIIPFAVCLAGPGLVALWDAARARFARA